MPLFANQHVTQKHPRGMDTGRTQESGYCRTTVEVSNVTHITCDAVLTGHQLFFFSLSAVVVSIIVNQIILPCVYIFDYSKHCR